MRKKKPEEHENHERWLVSYADFITLLFAFFVVMFAVSQVDSQKLGRFVQSVNVAFEYQGPFPAGASAALSSDGGFGAPGSLAASLVPPKMALITGDIPNRSRSELVSSLERLIESSDLQQKVRVIQGVRGVTVSLSEAGFFDSGSAAVRADSLVTLRKIGELLRVGPSMISVEGHTDNRPISTSTFPSNWELSTARATTIVRFFTDEMGYDPWRLSASGYAEYRPTADNASAAGRAQNRRVDLVIMSAEGGEAPVGVSPPTAH